MVAPAYTQLGNDGTTSNNLTIASKGDGSFALQRGNMGFGSDLITINADSSVAFAGPVVQANKTTQLTATGTFSFNPAIHGQLANLVANNAITVTFDVAAGTLVQGATYIFVIRSGDTASRTFSYTSSTIKMPGGAIPLVTGTNTPNGYDLFQFIAVSTSSMICVGAIGDIR